MNTILEAQSFLLAALRTDPTLSLACLTTWLDPLAFSLTCPPEADEELFTALQICRRCFPDIYAQAMACILHGCDERTIDRTIVDGINLYLVAKIDTIEGLGSGVPCDILGIAWDCRYGSFEEEYPRLVPVIALLGIWETYTPEDVALIAVAMGQDLCRYDKGTAHHDLGCLLLWLFGATQNYLVDYDHDSLWESGLELAAWTLDDIEAVNEQQRDANEIVQAGMRGLALLETSAAWREALEANLRTYRNHFAKRRNQSDRVVLSWPAEPGRSASDTTYS